MYPAAFESANGGAAVQVACGDGIVGSIWAVAAEAVDWRRGGGAGVCAIAGVKVSGESASDGGSIGGVGTAAEVGLGVGAST